MRDGGLPLVWRGYWTGLTALRTIVVAAFVMSCGSHAPSAQAQDVGSSPASTPRSKGRSARPPANDAASPTAVKDPADAMRSYSSGVIAYQAGKFEAAIQAMNGAVQSGGLPSNLLAKALYIRGASFQQQHKPGQAISDLTSALWFKGGLDDEERAEATKFRSAAYRDAGLSEQGQIQAANDAASGVEREQASTGSTVTTGSAGSAAPAPIASSSGVLGGFFDNLFGSSKPAAPASASKSTTSVPAASPTVVATSGGTAETLPWASHTDHSASGVGAGTVTSAAGVGPSAGGAGRAPGSVAGTPKIAGAKGRYRIQIAAVQSRDEASAIIANLQSKGGVLAAAPASVDESKFGSSTFYRVRLGPYATAAATKAPCDALKANGLDCLVTAK